MTSSDRAVRVQCLAGLGGDQQQSLLGSESGDSAGSPESYSRNQSSSGGTGREEESGLSLSSAFPQAASPATTDPPPHNNNNNNNTITKIKENHLSTKVGRARTAPYLPPAPRNMYDSLLNGHQQQQQQQQQSPTKHEPNGNNIEIDCGEAPGDDAGMNNSGSECRMGGLGGSVVQLGHLAAYGGLGGESVIMGSAGPGNGGQGGLMVLAHGNGLSLTSPGDSLEDQDCDEEKVINGDTFSPGDVPDPDAIKMFVGQIPKHLSESELKTLFEEYGRVFQINVLRDKASKQSKGCCFVTFYTRKAALEAQNALHNVKTLSGMNHPIQMKPADNENRYERKLFVGMLSKKLNEVDVRNMFSRYGHIDECTVLRDPHGTSRGCAFITFASKQCAQSAIKALHHSMTMEGCSSPVVVKFADTQKDKDQRRHHQIQSTMIANFTAPSPAMNAIAPQSYFSILHQLQQQQQQQQQQQSNNYFSQLNQLGGLGTLTSLASPSSGATLASLTGSHAGGANSELAALAALVNFSGVTSNQHQHSLALGVQAAVAAAIGGSHSSLSPSGANGSSLGSTNSLASSFTGNGLHSGLSSYTSALRSNVVNKQAEGPEGANLFIYHLPPEAGDAALIQMFTTFGTVISAKVFIDKNTNLSKCFGFVSYDNAMSAQLAIQAMNGYQVGMKRLKVQLKRSKEAAKPY